MKCPFRINTITRVDEWKKETIERQEFAECYGDDCPYFKIVGSGKVEVCKRAEGK